MSANAELSPIFKKLTPDAAIDAAYMLHDTMDPFSSDEARELSRRGYEVVLALAPNAQEDPTGALYFARVSAIIVSLGKGLTNMKNQHHEELRVAEELYELRKDQLNLTQAINAIFRGMWKAASTVAMGFLGYALAQLLALLGLVSDSLVNQHGHTDTTISLAIGAVVFMIYGYLTFSWGMMNHNRVHSEYGDLKEESEDRYAESGELVFKVQWEKLCDVYKEFTGKSWGNAPAYLRVHHANRSFARRRRQLLGKTRRTTIALVMSNLGEHANAIREHIKSRGKRAA